MSTYVTTQKGQTLETPSFINFLFSDKRASIIWLIARLWLGYEWIQASLHKLSSPDWMVTCNALKGFWMGAVKIPAEGRPAIAYDWYRNFLQAMLNAEAYTCLRKSSPSVNCSSAFSSSLASSSVPPPSLAAS